MKRARPSLSLVGRWLPWLITAVILLIGNSPWIGLAVTLVVSVLPFHVYPLDWFVWYMCPVVLAGC